MTPLRELFDGAGDGVAVIDGNYRLIYWNRSAEEILGYTAEEAVGKTCFDIFKGLGERGTIVCSPDCSLLQCAFRGEKIHSFNLLTPHKEGRTVWLNLSTLYVRKFEGQPGAVVHMFRDVDRLQRAQQLLGEFLLRASEVATRIPLPQRASPPQSRLTKRERQVLALLGQGLSAKDIASKLAIRETTARNHIQNILAKLGLHSRLEAALYALERDIA